MGIHEGDSTSSVDWALRCQGRLSPESTWPSSRNSSSEMACCPASLHTSAVPLCETRKATSGMVSLEREGGSYRMWMPKI